LPPSLDTRVSSLIREQMRLVAVPDENNTYMRFDQLRITTVNLPKVHVYCVLNLFTKPCFFVVLPARWRIPAWFSVLLLIGD
jgi:hypothetical protein